MAVKIEEITAKFLKERYRFENDDCDVIIGEASMQVPFDDTFITDVFGVKGPALLDELRTGQEYVFYGKWTSYTNRRSGTTERQFAFTSFVQTAPVSREAVISYISQHGEGCGVGKARAKVLWESFGQEAVETCRTDPARVVESLKSCNLKVTLEQAEELAANLQADAATEKAKMNLVTLLEGRGFPKSLATQCLQTWGNKSAQIIRRDPYRLMRFKHCGFKRCDSMWMDLGLSPNKLKRQAYCVWHSLARVNDGSTWFSIDYPKIYLSQTISGTKTDLEAALTLAKRGKIISELKTNSLGVIDSQDGTKRWFAEAKNAHHEAQIAQSIVYARGEKNLWPDVSQLTDLSEHQRAELRNALQDLICILGGSPGTGKTFCVASLVELIGKVFGYQHVIIGTPTGKAAVRVTENLSLRGIPVRARTWHSLLNSLDSEGLQHFPVKFIIGDETSMNDTDLMARILRARSVGSHVLFVGDINQLPPVGHGAPLRDMIAAGVAYGELREIKRNSGGIVEACAAIRDNVQWTPGDNLILDHQNKAENQIASLLRWLDEAKKQGIDPVWECQPVVAVNEKSPLSRKELNKILQQRLNTQPGIDGIPFRLKDKLVNTENGYFSLVESKSTDGDVVKNQKGEVYVANGELAKVIHLDGKVVFVELQSPHRVVSFNLGRVSQKKETDGDDSSESGNGCTFDLGYALSVHKSQGSDWPWVLPLLDDYPGATRVCDRSWLYTAISRAKSKCILIGTKHRADSMCKVSSISKRKTFLREQILMLQSIEELAGV